ncbi:hypothetical protein [Curtobacterium sp. SL109]|uniref:hypothetical protein n=1 Tax=Curtobacterium sp. SL109 TaxID=2994662 RepID=UPI002273E668|nr:hypothetical protein [Curtobacterium sp. SL109]MCY1693541.1 hypothetical protein [Curtobacterium sp. SL109]
MRFDEVLTRDDGPAIAAELAAMRKPARYVIEGVHQDSPQEYWQFRLDVDEPRQSWTLDRSDSPPVGYRDGLLRDEDYPNGSIEETFYGSTTSAPVVRMVLPELMLRWGRGPESFHPILLQHIGLRSILATFEHREDPATRTTLVINEHDGIARRSMEYGGGTIVTSVRTGTPDEVLPPARFEPLTDWIRSDY